MNIIFIEPAFPYNQREFVRGLHAAGATIIGIGERPQEHLDDDNPLQGEIETALNNLIADDATDEAWAEADKDEFQLLPEQWEREMIRAEGGSVSSSSE